MPTKRAIEEDFPIVEINRLAVPERNSFKPIYQMHKWFARRASCVFRAILLGALKPAGTNIMEEFYKDHSKDPDTNGKVILDPFMGGGTTVVEALRLGCKVVGIDLNPVAWFIVKTEVEPVDLKELDAAFERLANHTVPWSGKPLRQTLLDLYKTAPPWTAEEVCGLPDSDVIYTFWVKSAICTSPTCRKQVPLFSDYIVAGKSPSIRYYPDCKCPKCNAVFDWEIDPAALIADPRLMLHSARNSNGKGSARWTYAHPDGGLFVAQGESDGTQAKARWGTLERGQVCCPHCYEKVKVSAYMHDEKSRKKRKPHRKKVPMTVLLCPQTEDVFQWRGELAPDVMVTSPAGYIFDPQKGHVTEKGRFVCPDCGNNDAVIESVRSLPPDEVLPMHAYAMHAYAPGCDMSNDTAITGGEAGDLFEAEASPEPAEMDEEESDSADISYTGPIVPPTQNLIWKQSGKFYARHAPADQSLFSSAEKLWGKNCSALPYPKSAVPHGEKTKTHLLGHHYCSWHQLFNERQLLALSTILMALTGEQDLRCRNLLLCAFSNTLESNNTFTRNIPARRTPGGTAPAGIFARHDFHPKATYCKQNVWGTVSGNNTYISRIRALREGLIFARQPYEGIFDGNGKHCKRGGLDPIPFDGNATLLSGDSRTEIDKADQVEIVITDPPYADNVNYSELADFFYVWLRLVLKFEDIQFAPEYCPKTAEIVENKTRGLSMQDFEDGLTAVIRKSGEKIAENGLVIFTFHHAEGSSWESVLNSVCNANLVIEAIYPVHSEREASLHLQDNEAIAYDLIHVCRKRRTEDTRTKRSWAGLRQSVRQRAREEVARIESGRYGGEPLPSPDIRMVLIGKCLEVYSRHYGAVVDWNGEPYPLRSALQDIRMMVEQIVSKETPLPGELESVDAISQVWLLAMCDKREVSVDSISKFTRGVFEVGDLTGHKPPLLRKGRVKGGRTYEVLTPSERLDGLRLILRGVDANAQQLALLAAEDNAPIAFGPKLVDVVHLLAGNAEQGERLDHLVERFRGQREQIRAALQYLKRRDPDRWSKSADKLLPFYDDLFAQAAVVANT